MVDDLFRHLHSWRAWVSTCNLWNSHHCRRAGNSSLGLVHRLSDGNCHRMLWSELPERSYDESLADYSSRRISLSLPNCWGHVLRDETCCTRGARSHMGLDHRLVQLFGSSIGCGINCLYPWSNGSGACEHELGSSRGPL